MASAFVSLFLCATVMDLARAGHCDDVRIPSTASATLAASAEGSNDACERTCVPDCYCCSISELASAAVTLPPLTALTQARPLAAAFLPVVDQPVPKPPPLACA